LLPLSRLPPGTADGLAAKPVIETKNFRLYKANASLLILWALFCQFLWLLKW
jgi:hypothetical protein